MLHSICQQIWKTLQWLEWVSFNSSPNERQRQCSNCYITALISHTSKVLLKILRARLQQYMNHELLDVHTGFRKGRGTRDQIANICWIIKKAREFQKNIYFCFIDYTKVFDYLGHKKLWKIIREMEIPHYLPPEKSVCRSRSNSWNWTLNNRLFQIRKWVHQGCILSPCLFNLYADYIMWNARLNEAQAGIKIGREKYQ